MLDIDTDWLVTLAAAKAAIPNDPEHALYAELLKHGTMRLGFYTPAAFDGQLPHDQDEIYIVIRGDGQFLKGNERRGFKAGDAIFVEAGAEHRFLDFSADFAAWVFFWGPPGGEG